MTFMAPGSKLLVRLRQAIRLHHYSPRTEEAYVGWVRRFVRFNAMRHPSELGAPDVTRFPTTLVEESRVSASTQGQALSALLFLYRQVLGCELESLGSFVRAAQPVRLPVVLTREEVRILLDALQGSSCLVATLMYGSGLRLLETLQIRIKDLDFSMREILVRALGRGSLSGAQRRSWMPSPPTVSNVAAGQIRSRSSCPFLWRRAPSVPFRGW